MSSAGRQIRRRRRGFVEITFAGDGSLECVLGIFLGVYVADSICGGGERTGTSLRDMVRVYSRNNFLRNGGVSTVGE